MRDSLISLLRDKVEARFRRPQKFIVIRKPRSVSRPTAVHLKARPQSKSRPPPQLVYEGPGGPPIPGLDID